MKQIHPVTWYLPDEWLELSDLTARLFGYGEEMQRRMKGTSRTFEHAGVAPISDLPPSSNNSTDWTRTDYPFRIAIRRGTMDGNAYAGTSWDAGTVCVLDATQLFSEADQTLENSAWYVGHISSIIHEFGHGAGLWTGEFYDEWNVPDNTGSKPKFDLNSKRGHWKRHPDWLDSPAMCGRNVTWSRFDRAMLAGNYRFGYVRPPCCDIHGVRVRVKSLGGKPVEGATVAVYGDPESGHSIRDHGKTDDGGLWSYDAWDSMEAAETVAVQLVRVTYKGRVAKEWLHFAELQEAALLHGKKVFEIGVKL